MDLKMRLDILKEAGQLSEENYINIFKIIEVVESEYNTHLTEENGSMFVTHMVMALSRIERDEAVSSMDEFLIEEIVKNENYEKARVIIKKIEEIIEETLPDNEVPFIGMHLCTLFSK